MRAHSGVKRFAKRVERARADVAKHDTNTADRQRPEMLLAVAPMMPTMTVMMVIMMMVVPVRGVVLIDTMGGHAYTTLCASRKRSGRRVYSSFTTEYQWGPTRPAPLFPRQLDEGRDALVLSSGKGLG